jgi:small conductance mechanosensitive channel
MADSSLDFSIRVWCNSADYGMLRSDLFEELNAAFERAGIEVPYNTLDVNIRK